MIEDIKKKNSEPVTIVPEVIEEKEDTSRNFMTVYEDDDIDYSQNQDGLDTGDGYSSIDMDKEVARIQKSIKHEKIEYKDGEYIILNTKKPKTTDILVNSDIPAIRFLNNTMRKEHPKLADYHKELNRIQYDKVVLGPRSQEMNRKYLNLEEAKRTQIRTYCKNEGIDRKDYLRWNG